MLKLSVKSALAHKRRLLGTALSVVIGIAFLAGTFVFTDTIQRTFDDLFADVYEETDAVVRSNQTIEMEFGDEVRSRIPDSTIAAVAAVPGVSVAEGDVQGFARIIAADGDALGTENGPPTFGGNISDSPLSPWRLTEGTAIVSLIVGVLVTMVAAIGPAFVASRVPPLAALRDVAVDRAATSRQASSVAWSSPPSPSPPSPLALPAPLSCWRWASR